MATRLERQLRHSKTRSGILLPLLEDFMLRPCSIESDRDVMFLQSLTQKMVEREKQRRDPNSNVFSPSALSQCLRQVYLKKHHAELGLVPVYLPRIEPNFYFLTGNFLHIKWQFALWKMEQKIQDPRVFRIIGFEQPILSKRKDSGGTVDVIALIYGEPIIVDFKGLNVRAFGEIDRGFVPTQYAIQVTDYMMLWNSQPKHHADGNRIERALLMAENKGGPDNKHPLALTERVIDLEDFKPEVRRRLGVLREHEANEEIPDPECTSTKTFQYLGCPFAGFCKKEVKKIEAERRVADDKNADDIKIARPGRSRNSRSRRNGRGG